MQNIFKAYWSIAGCRRTGSPSTVWFKPGCIDSRVNQNQLNLTTNGVSTYSFKRSVITLSPVRIVSLLDTPLMLLQHRESHPWKVWVLQEDFWRLFCVVVSGQQSENYSNYSQRPCGQCLANEWSDLRPETNRISTRSFRVSYFKDNLSTGDKDWRYERTMDTSQISGYLGLGGFSWKMPFISWDTKGCFPRNVPFSKVI